MENNIVPLISVIVPVYRVERYLDRCVESLINQTYRDLEIILVDDGSPDRCPAMCDAWAERDGRIRVIHKKNGGLSDARNAGMEAAEGEYIGFVDSDDRITPEMYQLLWEDLRRNGSDISACGVKMVWEDSPREQMLTESGAYVLETEDAMRAIIEETCLKQPVWNKLYRTELVRDLPFAVGKQHEDTFWSYRAVGRAGKVSVFDTPCYEYLQRGESIMGGSYSLKRLDALEAFDQRQSYVEKAFPELAPAAKQNLLFSCLYQYQQILLHLSGAERSTGLRVVKEIFGRNHFDPQDWSGMPGRQRLWAHMAHCSLDFTCRLRNLLRIGQ